MSWRSELAASMATGILGGMVALVRWLVLRGREREEVGLTHVQAQDIVMDNLLAEVERLAQLLEECETRCRAHEGCPLYHPQP